MKPSSATILAKGERGQIAISNIQIDPERFFTTLPSHILFEIGAKPESQRARMMQEDGSIIDSQIFSLVVCADGREDPTLAIAFEGAAPVLGAKFLEDLGLKIDAETGSLIPTRFNGFPFDCDL